MPEKEEGPGGAGPLLDATLEGAYFLFFLAGFFFALAFLAAFFFAMSSLPPECERSRS